MKLEMELIPETTWYMNLRKYLSYNGWEEVRKFVLERAGNRCEICGAKDIELDCHEVFDFNEATSTQTLVGVMALCKLCHGVKHIGHAKSSGSFFTVARHMAKINGITYQEAVQKINDGFALWKFRSRKTWKVDLNTWLKFYCDQKGVPHADTF